jgi:hypothetical protein
VIDVEVTTFAQRGVGRGVAPRACVRVVDLVRAGMRDLVAADIDGDGWIAPSDIAAFIAGNGPSQPTPRPMRRPL